MKNKKQIIVSVFFLAVVGIIIWRVVEYYHFEKLRRNYAMLLIPVDIDGDKRDELIVAYAPRDKRSLVEAYELKSGKVLWTSTTAAIFTTPDHRRSFVVGSGLLFISTLLTTPSKKGGYRYNNIISALDVKTGKERWSHNFSPTRKWTLYLRIRYHLGRVFLFTRGDTEHTFITAFEARSGRKIWEKKYPEVYSFGPTFAKGYMLLPFINGLLLIQLDTGTISLKKSAGFVFSVGQRYLYFQPNRQKYQLMQIQWPRWTVQPIMRVSRSSSLRGTPKTASSSVVLKNKRAKNSLSAAKSRGRPIYVPKYADIFRAFGIYKEQLIATIGNSNYKRELISIPFKGKAEGYRMRFPDGFAHRGLFLNWKKSEPSASSFHHIQTRFVPLILRKKLETKGKREKRILERQKQILAVIDLKRGKIHWKSRIFYRDSTKLISEAIVYRNGHFFIRFPYQSQTKKNTSALLILNGHTGRFRGVLKVKWNSGKGESYSYYPRIKPWSFQKGKIYGRVGHSFWVIDIKTLKAEYTRTILKNIRIISALSEVERSLGLLPK